MKNITHGGFTYTVYIRSWVKGNKKYEVIKYVTGLRNLWERVSLSDYHKAAEEKLKNQSTKK